MSKRITIIGGGNLGMAIAEGLVNSHFIKPSQLLVTKRNIDTLKRIEEMGVMVSNNNVEAARYASIIILAVKPFQADAVLNEIREVLQPEKQVLCSVVTGISTDHILSLTGKEMPVVRAMPNTAIAIRESMTCINGDHLNEEQLAYIIALFEQLGKVTVIDEKLMDSATVLGACGTAFAMRFIRANIQGGIEIGFDAHTASLIASQTIKGAAQLLLQKGTHPEQEIDKVTTPKGCTIAGLNEMEHCGFSSSLIRGIAASYKRILNLEM